MFRCLRSRNRLINNNRDSRSTKANRFGRAFLNVGHLEARDVPAIFTVTNLMDGPVGKAGDMPGSLRQAIFDANASLDPSDTINVTAMGTLTLNSGEFSIIGNTILNGPGASKFTIDADKLSRHFYISDDTAAQIDVAISGMTLINGLTQQPPDPNPQSLSASGGSMYVRNEKLSLDGMVIRNNATVVTPGWAWQGGAIAMGAAPVPGNSAGLGSSLTINNSAIDNNSALNVGLVNGGGIHFAFPNTGGVGNKLTITNSSVSENTSYARGGGIYFSGGNDSNSLFSMRNTTVSANKTLNEFAAGIQISSTTGVPMSILNSTITANRALASAGGGLVLNQGSGTITIDSSIIADNFAVGAKDWRSTNGTTATFKVSNSIVSDTVGLDPGTIFTNVTGNQFVSAQLAPLANNGGITRTNHPLPGSPAINKGSNPAPIQSNDQRGAPFIRSVGVTDVGALEVDPTLPFASGAASNVTVGGATPNTFTVTYTDDVGINVSTVKNNSAAVYILTPTGGKIAATYVMMDDDTNNGTPRTATYSFTPPGTTWDYTDNGTYLVVMEKDQVADTSGNFINPNTASGGPTDVVAQFTVAVGQSLVVTSALDSGPGSLREAIELANASAFVSDSISFDTISMGTSVIFLNSQYDVTDSVVINGTGITLDAGQNSRIMSISGPGTVVADITGMTFTNGRLAFGGFGGAISCDNEVLTVTKCTFLNNSTDQGNNGGGAIAMAGFPTIGKLTVIGSLFDGNSTGLGGPNNSGGAIYAGAGAPVIVGESNIIIQDSTFRNNTSFGRGGAITQFGGSLKITGSTFNNNTAGTSGGAISFLAAVNANGLLIQNATITGNTTGNNGGGIYLSISNASGRVLVANNTIVDNQAIAGVGGGVAVRSDISHLVDFENTVISGNKSVNVAPNLAIGKGNGSLGPVQIFNNGFIGIHDATNGKIIGTNNQLGSQAVPLNAVLAPLANNGGPTDTRRPFGGSPLVDWSAPVPSLSTLAAAITSATASSFTVASTTSLEIGMYIQIDAEIMQISNINATTKVVTVGGGFNPLLRGLFGTTATTHVNGSVVTIAYTQPANDQRGGSFPRVVNGKVDIGAVEIENDTPTAKLNIAPQLINTPTQTPYTIQVVYTDNVGLDVNTILNNSSAIRVTRGDLYNQLAMFDSIVSNTGTQIVVNYTITSPGPTWVPANNGFYTISTEAMQVYETGGAKFVEAYPIGTIRVSLPLSLVVNSTNDESIDTDGKLSIREAIIAANNNVFAPDTITFSNTVFNAPQTINLTEGELFIGDELTINNTNGVSNVTVKGVNSRIFTIDAAGSKTPILIKGLTMTGGTGQSTITFGAGVAGGGAIMNFDEALTVDGCVITANTAVNSTSESGGGILLNSRQATLSLLNSTLSGNTAGAGGGGLSLRYNNTTVTVVNCIIVGNKTGQFGSGGGIELSYGTSGGNGGSSITLDNTTIANNFAGSAGGGIFIGNGISSIPGLISLTNSTVSGNLANTGNGGGISIGNYNTTTIRNTTITANAARGLGGGVSLPNPSTTNGIQNIAIISSVIAGNKNKFAPDLNFGTSTTTATTTAQVVNSLIGAIDPTAAKITTTNSIVGTLAAPVNALLGPLVYNGGPTGMLTHTLLPGSPAINAGANSPTVTMTTLAADITSTTATTMSVANGAPMSVGQFYRIDSEIVQVTAISGTTATITRGQQSTTAATHTTGAGINRVLPPLSSTDQRGVGFPREFGTVDMGAIEINPALPVAFANFAPVKTAGATTQQLTITFADDVGINVSTIKNNNTAIKVTGPGGFNTFATYVSMSDDTNNGTPRTATFQFTPPVNGAAGWDATDNGDYTVSLNSPTTIADTNGNLVFATTINTLPVQIGRSLIVTNDSDDLSTAGSLRNVIAQANASMNTNDTITFDPAFFNIMNPRTIFFSTGQIVITDPVTVQGPGTNILFLNGNNQNRLFNLQLPAAQWESPVSFSAMSMTGGLGKADSSGSQGNGGVFVNDTAHLIVDGCDISNNNNGGFSAAVVVANSVWAPVTLRNSTFSNNQGFSGVVGLFNGGISSIYNSQIVTVENCTFTNNNSTANTTQGGVFNVSNGGTLNISKSSFIGNAAGLTGGNGGAIYADVFATLNISDSTFDANFTGTTGSGGAIRLNASSTIANINSSTFKNNIAGSGSGTGTGGHGGAIFVGSGAKLFLTGSTLSGNTGNSTTTTGGGGAIYLTGTAQVTVTNSTISGNTAQSLGGGILLNSLTLNANPNLAGALIVQNSTVAFNTAANNGGGGINWRTSTSTGTPNVSITSSIVAINNSPGAPDIKSGAAAQSFVINNSFVGDVTGATFTGSNNKNGDPLLNETLALNGAAPGSPLTHALMAGSTAIDNGTNPAVLALDQRGSGFSRTVNFATDMGAYEVQNAVTLPTVTSIQFNDGSVQRSMVTSIKVTFSENVQFPTGLTNGFSLIRTSGPTGAPLGSVNLAAVQVGNVVTLTFLNGGAVTLDPAGSLPDGKYTLTLLSNRIAGVGGFLDGNANGSYQGTPTDDRSQNFHRLFGDVDGNGTVNTVDFNAFRLAFGGTSFAFDYNGNGSVDTTDFNQFRQRFGSSV